MPCSVIRAVHHGSAWQKGDTRLVGKVCELCRVRKLINQFSYSAEFAHFTHKSCITFLPCTAVVHSPDHTTRHFKSSTYPEAPSTVSLPLSASVQHINDNTTPA